MELSRRGFVVGGLAAAIAGIGGSGVAATTGPGRRALHAAGLLLGDDHPAPEPPDPPPVVERRTLDSARMGRTIVYYLARPPGVDGPVPVVYALHGRGNDERFAVQSIRFQDFLAAAGVPVALVAPDGGRSSYWHPRRSGEDPLGMLVTELVPAIDAELGTADRPRGLIGWSMGGYGALLAAERNPSLFGAVALGSPALVRTFADTRPGAFDDVTDFRAHDVFTATDRLDGIPLTGAVGRDDPFVAGFRHLQRFLPDADLTIRPGFHDAAFWRGLAPAHAAFFGRHLL